MKADAKSRKIQPVVFGGIARDQWPGAVLEFFASGDPDTEVTPTVSAPSMFARRTAATVNGVVPDAAMRARVLE